MTKKPIARLITRMDAENDGLMFGVALKQGRQYFKPNSIYELQHCKFTGDITLKYIGESLVKMVGVDAPNSPIGISWGNTVNEILMSGSCVYMTREEYDKLPKDDYVLREDD